MAETTNISWCDSTFNPWIGCTKVSAGCDHCYAETLMDKRYQRVKWGHGNPRSLASDSYWRQPLQWQKEAEKSGVRRRVFCASLADVFDNEVPTEWRVRLFGLIRQTPMLDWLLLTKRPAAVQKQIEAARSFVWQNRENFEMGLWLWLADWYSGDPAPSNVWLGTSCEDQQTADIRIPALLKVPAVVRFLSCEPLLGPIDFTPILSLKYEGDNKRFWVIVGGESGNGARPMYSNWARSLRDQCKEAGVPFFFKQRGEWVEYADFNTYKRVGKKAAGDLLDGVQHHAFPEVSL